MRYFFHHRCHMARPQDSESVLRGALIYRWIYCRLAETSLWSRSAFGISWNIELATFFECLYFQLAKLNFSSHFASFKAWISSPDEYFIPTKFHQNPSSSSGEEVENVKSLRWTNGRTDDGRCAMTIAHSGLRLRWAKNCNINYVNSKMTCFFFPIKSTDMSGFKTTQYTTEVLQLARPTNYLKTDKPVLTGLFQ